MCVEVTIAVGVPPGASQLISRVVLIRRPLKCRESYRRIPFVLCGVFFSRQVFGGLEIYRAAIVDVLAEV